MNNKSFDWIQHTLQDEFSRLNYLNSLDTCGMLSFDNSGNLIGAYPVSPVKTKYAVEIEGIGSGYAMCAIDALGIAFTFGKKTVLKTSTFSSNQPIEIIIDPDLETQPGHDVVVTYTRKFQRSAAEDQCPNINFYASREEVPSDLEVELFSFQKALEHAIGVFSPEGIKSRIQAGAKSPMSSNNCCVQLN